MTIKSNRKQQGEYRDKKFVFYLKVSLKSLDPEIEEISGLKSTTASSDTCRIV
jgi:hypothetical protein